MTGGGLVSIALAIIGVGMLTVAVTHTQTANIIKAFGNAFSGGLGTAMGSGGTAPTR